MVDEGSEKGVGLVLAGAVARGAFGAGAVRTFAKKNPRIVRIAGTSSGALNAVLVAAGVAAGNLEGAASVLTNLWLDHGSWADIVRIRAVDWLHLKGLLDTQRLSGIVQDGLGQVLNGLNGGPARARVHLTLVTTNLDGLESNKGPSPLPTYEQPLVFTEKELVDKTRWPEIANAAVASATFPGVFSPTKVMAARGAPCIDGGAVNNAPISYLLWDRDTGVDTGVAKVVVVTSEPSQLKVQADFGGIELVSRIADVVIQERVARDLLAAHRANQRYKAISDELIQSGVPQDARERVLRALKIRPIELYLVRPDPPLEGDAFSGFFSRAERQGYVRAGAAAAMIPIV